MNNEITTTEHVDAAKAELKSAAEGVLDSAASKVKDVVGNVADSVIDKAEDIKAKLSHTDPVVK